MKCIDTSKQVALDQNYQLERYEVYQVRVTEICTWEIGFVIACACQIIVNLVSVTDADKLFYDIWPFLGLSVGRLVDGVFVSQLVNAGPIMS